jgi:hypothetical protein
MAEAARAALMLLQNAAEGRGSRDYDAAIDALELSMVAAGHEAVEDAPGMLACAVSLTATAADDAATSAIEGLCWDAFEALEAAQRLSK